MADILAPDDPRILVPIVVPLRGGKTLTLRLPRFEYMEPEQHESMTQGLTDIDNTPAEELSSYERERRATLVMLKPFLNAKDYKTCQAMTAGQLIGIRNHWAEQSQMPLGEFLASAHSSTASTGAQSNTTSTAEDGDAATSDAA